MNSNETYTAQDDFQLFDDAVANVPGARRALQARLEQLPEARAEFVLNHFHTALAR